MVKKMMILLVMAVAAMTANAQNTLRENGTITLQPKVGIGFGYLSGSWTLLGGAEKKTRVGLLAGVEGEYYANEWLGIAAGVNYAQQGWKFKGGGQTDTYKLDYLNVPIVGNFYVAKGLALKAGLQFGFLMSAKIEDVNYKDDAEKFNFSIPIGVSYEYYNFVLDLRYNISASKVNKKSDSDNKWRSDLLQLTLGYKFEL